MFEVKFLVVYLCCAGGLHTLAASISNSNSKTKDPFELCFFPNNISKEAPKECIVGKEINISLCDIISVYKMQLCNVSDLTVDKIPFSCPLQLMPVQNINATIASKIQLLQNVSTCTKICNEIQNVCEELHNLNEHIIKLNANKVKAIGKAEEVKKIESTVRVETNPAKQTENVNNKEKDAPKEVSKPNIAQPKIIEKQQDSVGPKVIEEKEDHLAVADDKITNQKKDIVPTVENDLGEVNNNNNLGNIEDDSVTLEKNRLEEDEEEGDDEEEQPPVLPQSVQSQADLETTVRKIEEQRELENKVDVMSLQNGDFKTAPDSHFFYYFIFFTCVTVMGYIAFHNKNKILALALEGRRGSRQGRRRPNSANYRKLDTNLEEAMNSHPSRTPSQVIY